MSVKLKVGNVEYLENGLWEAWMPKEQQEIFPGKSSVASRFGVVVVAGAVYDGAEKTLEIDPFTSLRAVAGTTDVVLFLEQGDAAAPSAEKANASTDELPERSDVSESVSKFLVNCRRHNLPQELIEAVRRLLAFAHSIEPFYLTEGEQRKWTATPNFIALTIQNRNRQLLISVKGDPSMMDYASIQPKVSRRPYCEFHFNSASQLDDTLDIVRQSIQY